MSPKKNEPDLVSNFFAKKVTQNPANPEPKTMNGGRTIGDGNVGGTVSKLPLVNASDIVADIELDPVVAIIGENVEIRPLQRHSYEFFQDQVSKLSEMYRRSNTKFNMSEYVRNALDVQMRKDGLIK